MLEKRVLGTDVLEAQEAFELPDREMLALVNVVALNGVTVAVPIGIAANVCGVNANVLAQEINQTGDATCEAETTSQAFQNAVARAGVIQ
jgi:hypothetical protein